MSNQSEEANGLQDILDFEQRRSKWPKRVVIILAVVVLVAVGWWYFGNPSDAKTRVGYRTAEVVREDLRVIVSATGTLEPVNQVDVGTEVSGTISSIKVDFNDVVKKGQVLAVLETTKLEAQRDQAQAALAVSKAEHQSALAACAEAKTDLARLKRTYKASGGRMPSRQELDSAQATYDKALAQVGVAKAGVDKSAASLKAYEIDLGKAIITAPIDGVVLNRQVESGQTVAASLSAPVLFTLAENLISMSLCVSVDEADVGQVKEGQSAGFVVDAYPDRTFPAKVIQVRFAPQESDGVVTYECILEVDNSDLLLRPGMTATANIVTMEVKDALLVPNAALRFTPPAAEQPSAGNGQSERGILAKLMPGPPHRATTKKRNGEGEKSDTGPKVWVLKDGLPVAVPVTLGPDDGVKTQIVSGDIAAGAAAIVGQAEVSP